jgi:hypothetical protein
MGRLSAFHAASGFVFMRDELKPTPMNLIRNVLMPPIDAPAM